MNEWLGPLCAFGSSVTWTFGTAGYTKIALRHNAFAVNFARASFALPLFVLAAFVMAGSFSAGLEAFAKLGVSHLGWLGTSMIASYGLGDAFFIWSCHAIGIPAALAIASAYPLWTALAGALLRGEGLRIHQWAGLLITVAGVATVILAGSRSAQEKMHYRRGAGLAVLVSFFWAYNSYAVAVGASDILAPVGNSVRMVVALGITWLAKSYFDPRSRIVLPVAELKAWSWLFALEAFGGSFMFMYGLVHAPLAIAAALSSLSPVLSVPLAWVTRAEEFSAGKTAGILAVVSGVILLLRA